MPEPVTVVTQLRGESRYRPPEGHRVFFKDARIDGVDFSDTTWRSFEQVGCSFINCDFQATRFVFAVLGTMPKSTLFKRCSFAKSDLRNAQLGNVRFEECDFSGARIEDWTSSIGEFIECRFAGKLVRTRFWGRPWGPLGEALRPRRKRNEFNGNDFRQAELDDCSFVGRIDVSQQLWPISPVYVRLKEFGDRIAVAARAIAAWQPGPERRDAEVMLAVFSAPAHLEQEEVFLRRGNLPIAPETQARVWELLERELPNTRPQLRKRRRRYLVVYDYGQGGVWAYLTADSREEIARTYPQLRIYDRPPEFLYEADLIRIAATMTVDVADREHPFLRELRRELMTPP